MDLDLTEDQEFFRETTRKFLESEMPVERVRELADHPDGFERDWWKGGAEMGWTSMLVPEEHGGGSLEGTGLLDLMIVAEEMGRLITPGPLAPTNVVAFALSEWGSTEQQAEFLPKIVTGDVIASWAIDEPDRPWGTPEFGVTATAEGNGFVLNGSKSPVEAASAADLLLVTASGPDGPTQLLVPSDAAGVERTPLESLDLVRRFSEVHFDGVVVPASAVLGAPGQAAEAIERQLQVALAIQLAETNGTVDRIFEVTLEWMFDRFSFGRPLASYQALKHRFADMKLYHEGDQAAATAMARAIQHSDPEAGLKASAAKAYVGDHATFVLQECIQMHGGLGVTWEYDLHLYLRRATTNQVQHGTAKDHRERVAQRIGLDEEAA